MQGQGRDSFEAYRRSRPGPGGPFTRENLVILLLLIALIAVWSFAWGRLDAELGITGDPFGSRAPSRMPDGYLTIVILDVGQGDATYIHTPGGRDIMIDCGEGHHPENQYSRQYPSGEEVVIPFLERNGITHLDLIILTHPDSDHGGGMPAVIDWLFENGDGVDRFIDAGPQKAATFYQEILEDIDEHRQIEYFTVIDPRGDEPRRYDPDRFEDGEWLASGDRGTLIGADPVQDPNIAFQILGPLHAASAANNNSVVVRVSCGAYSWLMTGDAEDPELSDVVGLWGNSLRATVLRAPHHGSKTSLLPPFLRAVNPRIITTSSHPPVYGHPAAESLRAWERYIEPDPELLRTDQQGDIWFRTDGNTLDIRTELPVGTHEEQWAPGLMARTHGREVWDQYRPFEANAPTTWEECLPWEGGIE